MSQTLNVHVRVNDAESGKPTAVRIRIADAAGRYFPPLGRAVDFPTGRNECVGGQVYLNGEKHAYIDGGCEIALPTGVELQVDISKGPCFAPIRQTVKLGEGQLTLRFAINKCDNASWNNFVHADSRCHFISPFAAKLEAEAEGIDLVNLLAADQDFPSNDGHMYQTTPNLDAFSGQSLASERVAVNTFHEHPALGHLALLHCHRPIFPLTFGHTDETDDWSLSDWCDQCHRKKGLVVWCDAYRPEAGLPGGEALINAILGKIDAIEIDAFERTRSFLPIWYRLLNAGIRLPIVGGSGKDSNRVALGGMRTLTPAGETRSYSEWIENVWAGRTTATNGPLLRLSFDGDKVSADWFSNEPITRCEIVANGTVIASGTERALEIEHAMPDGGWIAARCWSVEKPRLYPHVSTFAHTSPTWINTPRRDPAACASLRNEIEAVREWVETSGRFTQQRRKDHLLGLCDAALQRLTSE